MAEFKYPFIDTTMEFVNGFVLLKDMYKDDPYNSIGQTIDLKEGWYLKLGKQGHISLINDEFDMISGEDTYFDRHPSTMALILRDYLAVIFD